VLFVIPFLLGGAAFAVAEPPTAGVDPLAVAARDFEERRFDPALALLAEAVKQDAPARALDLRGCIYMEQGKWSEAMESFKAAEQADPKFFPPRHHYADALLRQGKWQEARELYVALMKQTNILMSNERLRYGVLIANLAGKDEENAAIALGRLTFPTESAAYYYSQAAWAFAHGKKSAAEKWLSTAKEIFTPKQTAWFARPLHDLGWMKEKPPLVAELQ